MSDKILSMLLGFVIVFHLSIDLSRNEVRKITVFLMCQDFFKNSLYEMQIISSHIKAFVQSIGQKDIFSFMGFIACMVSVL